MAAQTLLQQVVPAELRQMFDLRDLLEGQIERLLFDPVKVIGLLMIEDVVQ